MGLKTRKSTITLRGRATATAKVAATEAEPKTRSVPDICSVTARTTTSNAATVTATTMRVHATANQQTVTEAERVTVTVT